MKDIFVDSGKPLDVVAVGSWTIFDHLFRVERLPKPGDTVQIIGPIESIEQTYWGGCAPNNAATAAKLGAQAALVSVVGRDFRERGYQAYFEELGVDLRGTIVVEEGLSGHSFLFSGPHGDAICLSHLGVSGRQDEFEPKAEVLSGAKIVVINYRFDLFTLCAARHAAKAGALVIVSGNLSTAPKFARAILDTSHLLVCTTYELDQLLLDAQLGTRSHLFECGIQALVETRGEDGSTIQVRSEKINIPTATPREVVDPVGAGDGFVGGLATGLAFGYSLEDSVRLGAVVASFVVEAVGCQTNLPTFEQAVERLHDNFDVEL